MKLLSAHTLSTPAPPAAVFAKWADPSGWARWDPEVREARCVGEVREGAQGQLTPSSGPSSAFTITEFVPDRVFTNASKLPGARLIFVHRVEPADTGSRLTVEVGVAGPLAWLWSRVLRKNFVGAAASSAAGLAAHLEAA